MPEAFALRSGDDMAKSGRVIEVLGTQPTRAACDNRRIPLRFVYVPTS